MKNNTLYDILGRAARVGALTLVLLVCGTDSPLAAATPTAARQADRGLHALARGDADAAAQAFERARMDAPDDPVVRYDLGVSRYRQGDFAAAARQFATAVEVPDPDLAFAARHNLGNACFKAGDYAQAVGAYEHALKLRDDAETRFNLEEAKRRLQEQMREQQQKQGDKGQQGSDQQGQGSDQQQSGSDSGSGSNSQGQRQQAGQGSGSGSGSPSGSGSQRAGGQQNQNGQGSGGGSGSDAQRQANASSTPNVDNASGTRTGSGTSSVGDQQQAGRQRDVEKPAAAEEQKGPKPPDASQRAQALRHITVDPERVKAFLEQLEARERQAQLRYRGEKRRRNRQIDPFMMDPEELREYFDQQMNPDGQAPQTPPSTNEPDW